MATGGPPGEAYGEAVEHWTAEAHVYHVFDRILDVAATYQSPTFRKERTLHWAKLAGLSRAEVESLLAREQAEATQEIDFFVGLSADPPKYNDLDQRHGIWRPTLVTEDGRAIAPLLVRLYASPDPNLRALYPYLRDFWVGYLLRFPGRDALGRPIAGPDTRRLTLRLASAPARVDLVFLLPRAAASR